MLVFAPLFDIVKMKDFKIRVFDKTVYCCFTKERNSDTSKTSETSGYFAKFSLVSHPFRETFFETVREPFHEEFRKTEKYRTFRETPAKERSNG
jgi:hypothetical protein